MAFGDIRAYCDDGLRNLFKARAVPQMDGWLPAPAPGHPVELLGCVAALADEPRYRGFNDPHRLVDRFECHRDGYHL